jgi:hypothetical protein
LLKYISLLNFKGGNQAIRKRGGGRVELSAVIALRDRLSAKMKKASESSRSHDKAGK